MKLFLDKERLIELYYYYKEALLPVGIIIFCVLLTLVIIIPQVFSIIGNRSEYDLEKSKLQTLKDNLAYVSILDTTSLSKTSETSSLALPAQVDFDSIISSIYYAAAISGVSVGDFQFTPNEGAIVGSISSINVKLKILTAPEQSLEFIKQLYKIYPLSSATSIRLSDKTKEMTILFYYKPFISQVTDNSNPVPRMSVEDEKLLQEISSWKKPESAFSPAAASTSSGSLSGQFPF